MAFKINGNIVISDTSTITTSSITPGTDNTGDVGTSALTWNNGVLTNLTIDSILSVRGAIDLADNDILRLGSSDDWEFFHNGTDNYIDLNVGNLIIRDGTTTRFTFEKTTGNLTLTGSLSVNGNTTLGDANTDTITFTARQASDLLPSTDNTRNLGSSLLKYNTIYATLFSGTALEAYYADLAEIYETDAEYQPGTLVEFGGPNEVTVTTKEFSTKIAGVISTNPAYLMNKDAAGQPIALKGRVPCKVVGPVKAGDFIVSSGLPGIGKSSETWIGGAVIGKAIKDDAREEVRLVEIVVGVM